MKAEAVTLFGQCPKPVTRRLQPKNTADGVVLQNLAHDARTGGKDRMMLKARRKVPWIRAYVGEITVLLVSVVAILMMEWIAYGLPAPAEEVKVVSANDGLNMRLQAGMDGEVIRTLDDGEAVTVLSIEKQWAEIRHFGELGYCYIDYLLDAPAEARQVTAVRLRVRERPSKSADTPRKLSKGDTVTVIDVLTLDDIAWGKLEDGGWIMDEYLD